jgi:phosphatidylglycerophosphate synthase
LRIEITVLLALVAMAVTSMVVFRATAGAQVRTAEVARRGSFVFGDWIREWFYWFISPVGRMSVKTGLAPEVFNAVGLAVGFASGVAYGADRLPLGGALLLLSGITDAFDGLVARARGVVSTYGAFLDSTLDRFTEVAVFAGLAVRYHEPWPAFVIVAALGGSLLVSYARARGECRRCCVTSGSCNARSGFCSSASDPFWIRRFLRRGAARRERCYWSSWA